MRGELGKEGGGVEQARVSGVAKDLERGREGAAGSDGSGERGGILLNHDNGRAAGEAGERGDAAGPVDVLEDERDGGGVEGSGEAGGFEVVEEATRGKALGEAGEELGADVGGGEGPGAPAGKVDGGEPLAGTGAGDEDGGGGRSVDESVEQAAAGGGLADGGHVEFVFGGVDGFGPGAAERGGLLCIHEFSRYTRCFPMPMWILWLVCATQLSGAPVAQEEVRVRMRDGVGLATNVFLPAAEGRFPALVVRTPYNKGKGIAAQWKPFVEQGYAV